MITYKVYCPKCQSKDVETTQDREELEVKPVSIDDFVMSRGCALTSDLVYRYRNYTTKCKTCGYSKSFSV